MRFIPCAALAASCLATPAFAQSSAASAELPSPADIANKDSFTIGVGGALVPDYEGSNDYRLIPAAAIRGKVSGISFSTRGTYLYVDVIPQGSGQMDIDVGPIVGARLNRTKHHLKDDVVDLLPHRKTAWEVGGFAGVSFHGLTNPYDTLALHVDVLHDIGNAHESTTISPNVDFSTPLSRTTYASASVGAEFVSNRFANYYYSITPADSALTAGALPVFDADGGMKNWKASLLLNQSITGDLLHGFSIFGTGQYSRLVGDFKRSPIVSDRGSANQWLLGAGLAYTF
jgi:outer membrane scaffolding protein for murein synthesis (MipA/OmpV family)